MLDNLRLKAEGRRMRVHRTTAHSFHLHPSSFIPRALTLIELLVVIVILTTLVGGVLPTLSPNNDERKIRDATRGLQSYITLTQANAARTGRPYGIAFRELNPGDGTALEVFTLEVPPPFAGFSTDSRCNIVQLDPNIVNYGNGNPSIPGDRGNGGTAFVGQHDGQPLYEISFVLALPNPTTGNPAPDPFPPRTFRIGDVINVDGNRFLIVDDNDTVDPDQPFNVLLTDVPFLDAPRVVSGVISPIRCVWLDEGNGNIPPQGLRHYQIERQPVNSAEEPYQLPAGIVIDMQGSVLEGAVTNDPASPTPSFPLPGSLYSNRGLNPSTTDAVAIMFSPTGAVDSVFFNGNEIANASRITLMIGRAENAGIDPSTVNLDNDSSAPWRLASNDQIAIENLQESINWLNLDTRLLSIATRSGRSVVSEIAFVPTDLLNPAGNNREAAAEQIEQAHQFAQELNTAR